MNSSLFESITLDSTHNIFITHPIDQFNWNYERFAELWETHPENYHTLKIHGKEVLTPRWQQAYGKNYRYTGSKNNALEMTELLQPFLDWSCEQIDTRLNGMLLNCLNDCFVIFYFLKQIFNILSEFYYTLIFLFGW